jgi:hypothetical protein
VSDTIKWEFAFDLNIQAYYFKTTLACGDQQWLMYDPNAGVNGFFRMATLAERSAFLLPPVNLVKKIVK